MARSTLSLGITKMGASGFLTSWTSEGEHIQYQRFLIPKAAHLARVCLDLPKVKEYQLMKREDGSLYMELTLGD